MTAVDLIAEGRRLARPCSLLRPAGEGPIAAVWHEPDKHELARTGLRRWITIDARLIPGLSPQVTGFISVLTDERSCEGGRVEILPSFPLDFELSLRAYPQSVLPPVEAVFVHGSPAIGEWLADNGWQRHERYNENFRDRRIVEEYEEVWFKEYPSYRGDDTYAVLGGWHWPGTDDDWHDLVDQWLLVMTIHDAEPLVEAWHLRTGDFKVVQRIT